MSRVWRRTWHFKVRGFGHLQKQWFLVNRKPHHKKNTESHLVHTFYHSVFLLTFNVLWWKWVICLDPENCHTHHSFAGFQRLNEAAWFMDDGFAHPFIVSWSNAKHCEMREQCNWEKKHMIQKTKVEPTLQFHYDWCFKISYDFIELFSAPAPNLYQKHSGIPGVAKKNLKMSSMQGSPSKSANFLRNSLLGTHPRRAQKP